MGKKMDNRDEAKVAKAAFKISRDYTDSAVREGLHSAMREGLRSHTT
jgi:hypothetical protein